MNRALIAAAVLSLGCAPKPTADPSTPASTGQASTDASTASTGEPDPASTSTGAGDTTTSGGESAAGSSESSTTGTVACERPPTSCPSLEPSARIDVTTSDAAPYLVRFPSNSDEPADIVLFMPGGPGTAAQAPLTFDLWLGQGKGIDDFLVVMPYSATGNLPGEPEHVLAVLDEIEACFCNTGRVHLGGTSNGGRLAYRLALEHADRFSTLLGAPGVFEDPDPRTLDRALAGKRVFNAVGELDGGWRAGVEASHQALLDAGVDSTLYEMPGQGHILSEDFDESVFFAFWSDR